MIEIIARDTCSKCEGTKRRRVIYHQHEYQVGCDFCNGVGTVPRVLATFADAAELRATIMTALEDLHGIGEYGAEDEMDAVLAALGVNDD